MPTTRRQNAKMSCIAFAPQLPCVQRTVVGRADGDQVLRRMSPAFSAGLEMVQIEKGGVPTTRYAAAPLVALQHRAAQGRWNVLLRASAHVGELVGNSTRFGFPLDRW